ncbi:MAG: LCP family protein [Alkalibacterium sp.]|nr:LCP family protein [Alkalibacterium sp.]
MRSDKHIQKTNRNKWFKRLLLLAALLFAFIIGSAVGYYGYQVVQLLSDVSEDTPEELQDTSESDESIRAMHPISILILGLDEEDGARRSDSIMVATINPKEETTKLVSIPRDTLITLPNSERQEKFNAVYAIYGITGVIDFVEDYLTIPISFYATLNFEGLVDLVDAVGGITVDSPLSFTVQDSEENTDAIEIEEGVQELNGEEALGYARMRKQDPRGDFGRQERQRQVIETLIEDLLSFGSITNLTPILNAVRPNLQTNMTGQQIMAVASNYRGAAETIESIEILGVDDYVYIPEYGQELYVYLPFEQNLLELQAELREHMNIEDPVNDELEDSSLETIEGEFEEEESSDTSFD